MKSLRIKQMSPQLPVTNLERSITFYVDKLGFEVEFRYEDFYAGIIKDAHSIHLKLNDPGIAPQKFSGDDGLLEILFTVENIHQLYEDLSAQSVQIIQPLRQMPYGLEFYMADPDGNAIAFLEI